MKTVVGTGAASVALLQRRLRVGYARAGRLIDIMEQMGIISGYDGSKARSVLINEAEAAAGVLARLVGGDVAGSTRRRRRRRSRGRDPARRRRVTRRSARDLSLGARLLDCTFGRQPARPARHKRGPSSVFEIGTTLREARVRRNLTLQQVEEDTKIRVKYLQAMENEDFDLMPGVTYAKAFLRTYSSYLGLDANVMLQEYVSRGAYHGEHEPFGGSSMLGAPRSHRGRNTVVFVAVICLLVLGVIYVLGLGGSGGARRPSPSRGRWAWRPSPSPSASKPARALEVHDAREPAEVR